MHQALGKVNSEQNTQGHPLMALKSSYLKLRVPDARGQGTGNQGIAEEARERRGRVGTKVGGSSLC